VAHTLIATLETEPLVWRRQRPPLVSRDLERACPLRIRTTQTDSGREFTDRLFGLRRRSPTGQHEFDGLCAELGIEHRLSPPAHPQTNGMVERFNGRIEEVLQSHHVHSGEDLETTLHRYVLYNQQLPQSALGSKTPLQAMKDWHKMNPRCSGNSLATCRDGTPKHQTAAGQNNPRGFFTESMENIGILDSII